MANELGRSLAMVAWRPKQLRTERLLLRGYEPADCEAVFSYAADPQVAQFMAWERHRTVEDTRRFLDTCAAANYRAGEFDYAICERHAPTRVVGGLGVYWRSRNHGVMELGYVLSTRFWGKGYVPEAARCLIAHAFDSTDVQRIYAPVLSENQRSRRAASKIGMTLDGVLRSSLFLRGRRWDEAIYSVLRSDHGRTGDEVVVASASAGGGKTQ